MRRSPLQLKTDLLLYVAISSILAPSSPSTYVTIMMSKNVSPLLPKPWVHWRMFGTPPILTFGVNIFSFEQFPWTCCCGDAKLGQCKKLYLTSLKYFSTATFGASFVYQCSMSRRNDCTMNTCRGCSTTYPASRTWLLHVNSTSWARQHMVHTTILLSKW